MNRRQLNILHFSATELSENTPDLLDIAQCWLTRILCKLYKRSVHEWTELIQLSTCSKIKDLFTAEENNPNSLQR